MTGKEIREKINDAILVFIMPPSIQELENRLKAEEKAIKEAERAQEKAKREEEKAKKEAEKEAEKARKNSIGYKVGKAAERTANSALSSMGRKIANEMFKSIFKK